MLTGSNLYKALFIIALIAAAPLFHLNPDNFLADDAYFYPQIANEIVAGHGSTFHQISQTNGYQPLWMAVCIGAAWLTQGDKMALLHLLALIQVLLFGATLYFLYRASELASLRFFSLSASFLAILMLTVGGLRLFESHLAIALIAASFPLFLTTWANTPSTPTLIGLSFLLGLIFLARTDAFFYSASFGIAIGIKILNEQKSMGEKIRRIAAAALPAILTALAYMGMNQALFGHPVPISGVIKSSFPHVHIDWNALGTQGQSIVGISLGVLIIAILLSSKQRGLHTLFMVAFAAVSLHAAYIICFSWGSQWHYVTAFAATPLALQFLATRMWESTHRSQAVSTATCAAALLSLLAMDAVGFLKTRYNFSAWMLLTGKQSLEPQTEKSARLHLVDAINKNLPPGAGIAVFDSPGVLAYLTHARILPLDGLVNDRNYDREVTANGLTAYLDKHGIDYFLAPDLLDNENYRSSTLHVTRQGNTQINTVYAPIQKVAAETFTLQDSQIVFRAPNPVPGCHSFQSVACWNHKDLPIN